MDYRIDIFTVFIFLGVVQALFLSFFFLMGERNKQPANIFMGLFLLASGAGIFEIFLMYSGFIIHAIHWVDFSESLILSIGPLFYLFIRSTVREDITKIHVLHFVPFLLFTIYLIPFWMLPEAYKWNAWIGAYQPGLDPISIENPVSIDPWGLRSVITEITILHMATYFGLALYETIQAFWRLEEPFWSSQHPLLIRLRRGVCLMILIVIVILFVKIIYPVDTGDHLFAALIALVIYGISVMVVGDSNIFSQIGKGAPSESRELLDPEMAASIAQKVKQYMAEDKPYLKTNFSLPLLAEAVHTSTHHLSYVLNRHLGKSFYEFAAEYRIREAKMVLDKPSSDLITVEELAERVGYSSKSSFNNAFKKITGQTPSQYRDSGK